MARLEHVNVTVRAPLKSAEMLCRIFGWHIRWQGAAKEAGFSVHVGTDDQYVALYTPPNGLKAGPDPTYHRSGLNHIGVVEADLRACERAVIAEGYLPGEHYDYELGRRFYFTEENGVEIEVISYAPA